MTVPPDSSAPENTLGITLQILLTGSKTKSANIMSGELLNTKDQTEAIATKPTEGDDCSSNMISNNNYKMTRDEAAEIAETKRDERSQESGDAESESEREMSVVDRAKDEDGMTAENLSMPRTNTPDCPSDFSRTTTSRNPRPQSRSLAFSIDRIMASRNDDVGGRTAAAAASADVTTSEENSCGDKLPHTTGLRAHSRHWAQPAHHQTTTSAAEIRHQKFVEEMSNLGPASWLSRLQHETNELQQLASECRRHQLMSFNWRSSLPLSNLISRCSPLLYRHFQTSRVNSWLLDVARHTSPVATASRSGSRNQQPQPATILPGKLECRPDSERRHAGHVTYPCPSGPAEMLDVDGGRHSRTDADWSKKTRPRETPKFAASGALDLSWRSTVDEDQPTNLTSVLQPTFSRHDAETKLSESKLWMPMMDLKNGMKNVVNQDVERPVKQISCPVNWQAVTKCDNGDSTRPIDDSL